MDSFRHRWPAAWPLLLVCLIAAGGGCDDAEITGQLPPMAAVAVGERHSCGLSTAGGVYCWGAGSSGQLGTGGTASESYAVQLGGAPELTSIVAGGNHTCGLTADGAAYCWGRGTDGQLGTGDFTAAAVSPLPVAGGLVFRTISAGARHTCGLTVDGAVHCWGANELAQLGTGAEGAAEPAPIRVDAALTFTDIAAGYNHSCAVAAGGRPYCWGENRAGETGNQWVHVPGEPAERRPVPIANWGEVYVAVSAGRFFTCGLRDQGEVMCWGRGAEGQLGNSGATDYAVPQLVHVEHGRRFTPNDGFLTTIDAGGFAHACGISEDRAALCWGAGGDGQLGSGEFLSMIPTVVRLRDR